MVVCRAYGLLMIHILAQMVILFLCHADVSKYTCCRLDFLGRPCPVFKPQSAEKGYQSSWTTPAR